MEIYEQIKLLRKQKNISQQEVADYLGINQKTYSSIENGKIRLILTDFLRICKFLQIDPLLLINDSNDVIITVSEREAELLDNLNKKVQQNFIVKNINVNAQGDVIIGHNINKNK